MFWLRFSLPKKLWRLTPLPLCCFLLVDIQLGIGVEERCGFASWASVCRLVGAWLDRGPDLVPCSASQVSRSGASLRECRWRTTGEKSRLMGRFQDVQSKEESEERQSTVSQLWKPGGLGHSLPSVRWAEGGAGWHFRTGVWGCPSHLRNCCPTLSRAV